MKRATLLAAAAIAGCAFSIDDATRKSNRLEMNQLTSECMQTRGRACLALGDNLVGKSVKSRLSTWKEGSDKALGTSAYQMCCASGVGECCQAICEQNLTSSPQEQAHYRALALAYGFENRSPEEIAAEQEKMLASIIATERAFAYYRHQEAEENQATFNMVAGAATQVAQDVGNAVATGKPLTGFVYSPDPEKNAELQQQVQQLKGLGGQAPGKAEIAKMKKDVKEILSDYDKKMAANKAGKQPPSVATNSLLEQQKIQKELAQKQKQEADAKEEKEKKAAEKDRLLKACLARPIQEMTSAQTNPFQVYVTDYQSLLDEAGKCVGTPGPAWRDCIGMNARIWPDAEAQRDETDFNRRFNAAVSYLPSGPSACLYNQSLGTTRSDCVTLGKVACILKLQQNVRDVECANSVLPRVWEGELARNNANAEEKQAADCHRKYD